MGSKLAGNKSARSPTRGSPGYGGAAAAVSGGGRLDSGERTIVFSGNRRYSTQGSILD